MVYGRVTNVADIIVKGGVTEKSRKQKGKNQLTQVRIIRLPFPLRLKGIEEIFRLTKGSLVMFVSDYQLSTEIAFPQGNTYAENRRQLRSYQ